MVALRRVLVRLLNPYQAPRHPWLYRVWQTAMVFLHRPTPDDLAQVEAFLPPALWGLFRTMPPEEQAHGLRVWRGLMARGVTDPDLLTAGLLHDVGKTQTPLHLGERIWAVLARVLFPRQARRWSRGRPRGWRKALVVARHHAAWGARLLEDHGASPLTVALTHHHHDDPARVDDAHLRTLLELLQEVDQKS